MRKSPFYLLYGRDPCLPTENFLRNAPNYEVDVGDYHLPVRSLEVGKEQRPAELAQVKQKEMYDKHSKLPQYGIGARLFMVFIPNENKDMIFSHAIPVHGPYCILNRTPNNAKVYLIY